MALELVTGYQGAAHVTAAQDADLHRGLLGINGILNIGNKLAVSITSANQITVADGVVVMDGREVYIGYGETVNVAIEGGTQGYYRNDLVVIKYTKDAESGVESVEFEVVQGTPTEGTPTDPTYSDTDIRTGMYTSQKLFARVRVSGVSIEGVDVLMDVLPTMDDIHGDIVHLNYDGAGVHNSIYRGKYLGDSVTDAQWESISGGTFDDLFIGDYWTIDGVNWRIAAFDYYYKNGDTSCTTHHAVIVPDTSLYSAQMNSSNTTSGGYVGSEMYTTNLETAKTTINSAFGTDHILSKRVYLTNAITSGYASAGSWYDSKVELMNENMVYGSAQFRPQNYLGTTIPNTYIVEKAQLPLFAMRHDLIGIRTSYWLRDVCTSASFAYVGSYGISACSNASASIGVRPAFCIS